MDLSSALKQAVEAVRTWEDSWGPFERHPSLHVDAERMASALHRYTERLRGNYPFFHPRYAGQMLKPPHPAAVTAYLAAMLVNPNNHALDGGPPTATMEKEVVARLAALFGLPGESLGHLTGGGTVANLEALWVASRIHPQRGVAFSEEAHYTHRRMSELLGLEAVAIPTDAAGRMRLDALEDVLRAGRVGTVVLTTGTTGVGAVDPVADVLALRDRYGCRVHVDGAYGGFFTLLAGEGVEAPLSEDVRRHLRAVSAADSVVVDPHKHGLQPYGCGCILFRDPAVGRFYRHDSPYTYFTSDELHLGEISLECSRPGAAAGALWLTLELLPLSADEGLGPILAAGLRAARAWHARLEASSVLAPYRTPELDIVTFFPLVDAPRASAVDAASARLFEHAMQAEEPVFLSLYRAESERLAERIDGFEADGPHARILRSVLMKPEHEPFVPVLHDRLSTLAAELRGVRTEIRP